MRRKRRAGLLLAYWAATVVIGVLQPCCETIAAAVSHDEDIDVAGASTRAALQEALRLNHVTDSHDNRAATMPSTEKLGSRHFHCLGFDTFRDTPAIATQTLNPSYNDIPQKPFASISLDTVYAGPTGALYRIYGLAETFANSAPVYLTTRRLRL